MTTNLQKAIQLLAVDPSLQPPQKWQEEKTKEIKTTNPGYSQDQINTAITKMWTELPESDKSKAKMGQPVVSAPVSHLVKAIRLLSTLLTGYVYANEDEDYEEVLDEIQGDTNAEVEKEFEDLWGSNDYNLTYVEPSISRRKAAEEENVIYGVDEKNNIVYFKEFSGGKFPDNVVQYLYKLAVVDQKGDSLGDMNFGMYYKLTFDPPLRIAEDENNIRQAPAALLRESKSGTVECEYYTSEEIADNAWDEIERRYEKFLTQLGV